MPSSAVVLGAAPVWIGDRLNEAHHQGHVVHAGRDAVYFRSDADVIGVVSRHGVQVPCAISTLLESVDGLFLDGRPKAGDPVTIGAGVVDFGAGQVRVGRYSTFAMRRFERGEAGMMRTRLLSAVGDTAHPDELHPTLIALLRDTPSRALMQVLGNGSGLTPFGDDVVCGMLATLLACGAPCATPLRDEVLELAPQRTTSLSAALLRRTAEGDVLPAFAHVVSALLDHPARVPSHIARLRAVGHTSGAGMLLGLHLALDHIHTRSCCP